MIEPKSIKEHLKTISDETLLGYVRASVHEFYEGSGRDLTPEEIERGNLILAEIISRKFGKP